MKPVRLSNWFIPSGDELLGIRRAISFPLSVSEEFNPMASEQELTPNGKGTGWVKDHRYERDKSGTQRYNNELTPTTSDSAIWFLGGSTFSDCSYCPPRSEM